MILPRSGREKSQTGIYHIMLRGLDKREIFIDDRDNEKFIEALYKAKDVGKFNIYAYCLMKNHVHLLIQEGEEDIGTSIQRIAVSYVRWHNIKYGRVGHLFQNRFKSEPVNSEGYLLTVLRYIHQNPVKANMVNKASVYPWSSYQSYLDYYKGNIDLVDTRFIIGYFKTRKSFEEYMNETNEDECLEFVETKKYTDDELGDRIKNHYKIDSIIQIKDRLDRNRAILMIYEETGVSIRQLSRVLGVGKSLIENATKKTGETSPCLEK